MHDINTTKKSSNFIYLFYSHKVRIFCFCFAVESVFVLVETKKNRKNQRVINYVYLFDGINIKKIPAPHVSTGWASWGLYLSIRLSFIIGFVFSLYSTATTGSLNVITLSSNFYFFSFYISHSSCSCYIYIYIFIFSEFQYRYDIIYFSNE